jgi:hypothetical protein
VRERRFRNVIDDADYQNPGIANGWSCKMSILALILSCSEAKPPMSGKISPQGKGILPRWGSADEARCHPTAKARRELGEYRKPNLDRQAGARPAARTIPHRSRVNKVE